MIYKRFRDTDYYVSQDGHIYRKYKTCIREVSTYPKRGGRYYVKIYGKEHTFPRVVYECFYGTIPDGYVITHRNECKSMNNKENLICVKKEKLGKMTGSKQKRKYILNCDNGQIYTSTRDAEKKLYICRQTVCDICNGKVKKPLYNLEWIER